MAAPTYGTDLTILDDAVDSTGWAEPTASGWTLISGITSGETDFYIQGGTCNSASIKSGIGGLLYNAGTGITIPTDGAVTLWMYLGTPGLIDVEASGGVRFMIGSSLADFYAYSMLGSDSYAYGGWRNLACADPSSLGTASYTVGSPTSTRQYFGWAYSGTWAGTVKGFPYGVDIVYYGRCEARFSDGDVATPATFSGFAATNDNTSNRYGLIQAVDGGYLWKGLMTLGYAGAVYFSDANKNIIVDNTKWVTANFNKIEINNTSSTVIWSAISFQSLGTVSKGRFEMVDDATVTLSSCTFTDMDTFIFKSKATVTDTIFRRCGQVTISGGTFTGCTFTNSTAASNVLTPDPASAAKISNSSFISDGTGHGIEIGGTAANMTLTNVDFTNYAASDGSTGNEAVYVNIASGSMNLTIDGGTTPSVRTAGANVTIVAGAVNATIKVTDIDGANIQGARVLAYAITGGPMPTNATVTITNNGVTGTVSHTAHGMATNDKVMIKGASHYQNNGVFTITKNGNDSYWYIMDQGAPGSDPTGTIKATYVALFGTTDTNGEITMSRVFASDQPIAGRVRKSTSPYYYKTTTFTGIIDSGTGYTSTLQLLPDT